MPTNARVNVQKDNVTDALSSSVVVPTGEALTIASGGSLTAEAGSIVNIPASGITGLGTMATQNANAVAITGGSITGITDLAIADGGTGASNATDARTNLGLGSIATQSASNVAITGGSITGITDLAVADGGTGTSSLTGYVKGAGTTPLTASSTIPNTDITGLGTMSTQNASSVAITGGSITGITDLAVADGGTGASNAADARVNLGVSTTGTSILYGDGAGSFSNVTIGSGVSFTGGTLSATGTGGTVTTVSVTTANGVSGTVANPTTTPAISLSLGDITPTTVNSVTLSGSATPNLAVTGTSTISGTNTGDQTISITGDVTAAGSQNTLTSTVTKINGQALATLATGILKNTTSTGVPSIAVAADFPTLNQNTTGNAATATNVAVTGVTGLGTGVASFLQTPTSANLSSMVTDETGSGDLVFANSPVLITPHLDTPSVLTLTNATGLPLSTGVIGTLPVANGGTGVTTSTGTGSTVLSASPTFTGTPAAPTAAVGTNTTQIATTEYVQSNRGDKYLTTSNSTNTIDNGNGKVFNCAIDLSYIPTQPVTIVYDVNNHMHGFVVSYNITTGVMVVDIDSHTGTGTYSAWTINIGGLTSVGGALLSANNLSDVASAATSRANLGVTATGQDTTYLYRANNLSDLSSATTARTNLGLGTMATQNASSVSISGGTVDNVTLVTPTISSIINTGTLTLPNQTDTLVGRATTDVLTNKTLTSPVMTTPSLGVASATSINKVAITAPATGATLTIADGATLTASATATVSGTNTGDQTISITGDVTASGSTGVLTSTVTKVNGTSLAGLATGILKNTTGTGVPSIAVSGSDYAPATSGNSILYGNSAGGFSNVTIGSGVAFSGGTLSATGTGGTVTTVSVTTANGVSGSVANPTTTPAISLTLGAITPTSVNSVVMSGSSTPTLAVTGTSSISGSNTGDQTTISGNAGTATALQTARTIGGSSFDGTANVTSFPSPGAIGGTTPSSGAFTSVTSLSDTGGYQITAGQLTGGDRMGISGQASGSGTALVFFDNGGTVFRPSIFDASSHSFKIGGVATTSITSTGFQGAIGATTAATGAFTTVTATTPIASSSGGTGNGFAKFSGPASSEKTFTLPNANATLLYDGGALGTPTSGTVTNLTGTASININGTVGATTASTGAFTTITGSGLASIADTIRTTGSATSPASGQGIEMLYVSAQTRGVVRAYDRTGSAALQLDINDTGGLVKISNGVAQVSSTGLAVTGALSSTTLYQGASGAQGLNVGFSGAAGQGFSLRDTTNSRTYFFTTETSTGLQINAGANPISLIGSSVAVTGALSSTTGANFATSSGSVGIGVASAAYKLDVDIGAVSGSKLFRFSGASGQSLFGYADGGGVGITKTDPYNSMVYFNTSNGIELYTASTQRVVVNSSGNVGIGTTSPNLNTTGTVLHVSSTSSGTAALSRYTTGNTGFAATDGLDVGMWSDGDAFFWLREASNIRFATNSTERMRIDSSGNVGIGTTSPGAALDVTGIIRSGITVGNTIGTSGANGLQAQTLVLHPNSSSDCVYMRYQSVAGNYAIQTVTGGASNGNLQLQPYAGNLLVGTTSNTEGSRLFVSYPYASSGGTAVIGTETDNAGNIRAIAFRNPNGLVGTINTNGSNTNYNTSSDYRLKDITGPLTNSGTFIDALKPKIGTWKIDGSKFVGFLAHEFAEVSPSSVSGEKDAVDSDGKPVYQGMQASSAEVIANLVAELQSLRQRVAALESN